MNKILSVRNEKSKDGMPILVIALDKDNEIIYCIPKKGYCFQVLANLEGGYELGVSDVIGFANIIKAFEGFKRPDSAFSVYSTNSTNFVANIFRQYFIASLCSASISSDISYENSDIVNMFIDDVVAYVTELIK